MGSKGIWFKENDDGALVVFHDRTRGLSHEQDSTLRKDVQILAIYLLAAKPLFHWCVRAYIRRQTLYAFTVDQQGEALSEAYVRHSGAGSHEAK